MFEFTDSGSLESGYCGLGEVEFFSDLGLGEFFVVSEGSKLGFGEAEFGNLQNELVILLGVGGVMSGCLDREWDWYIFVEW